MTSKGFSIRNGALLDSNLVDELIYIDTNVGYSLVSDDNIYREDMISFIERVNREGKILVRSSHFSYEFYDSLVKGKISEEAKKIIVEDSELKDLSLRDATKRIGEKRLGSLKQEAIQGLHSVESILNEYSVTVEFNDYQVNKQALVLDSTIPKAHIADSKHVAIAYQHHINSILTTDAGFLDYDNLNVYSPVKKVHNNFETQKHTSLNKFNIFT